VKKLIAITAAFGLMATALTAGGPVVVEDAEAVVVEEKPASSAGWVIPALLIAIIGIAILSDDDDTEVHSW